MKKKIKHYPSKKVLLSIQKMMLLKADELDISIIDSLLEKNSIKTFS